MNELVSDNIISFPSSFYKPVKNGVNEYNTIVPLDEFTKFSISCNDNQGSFQCLIGDEVYPFDQPPGLDLILPQGMVQGPDWYRLLKPIFFPPA